MPRAKDIAWKFVIRLEGDKWRCPYCEIESSGSVPRVRSHLLKQTKGGIAPCKKVPEHISALMELLQNEVHNKEDIAWKFVDRLKDSKWRCHYCSGEFFGDLTGVKRHLLKVPNEGISICTDVPNHVRKLWLSLLDEVGEEESREVAGEQSREAPGQSSVEPQSRDMPTQAEGAEKESGEANRQFPMESQSRDMQPSPVGSSSHISWDKLLKEYPEDCFPTAGGVTNMAEFHSDHQQGERRFDEPLAVRSPAQNSHGMFM
ncbi:hypothetical protein BT93_F1104 [Corymbia citriodora subsp. variegata]|nr:hypothetical protein BT93_F1104 [Corymbia citriodora subsp. variegata]